MVSCVLTHIYHEKYTVICSDLIAPISTKETVLPRFLRKTEANTSVFQENLEEIKNVIRMSNTINNSQ